MQIFMSQRLSTITNDELLGCVYSFESKGHSSAKSVLSGEQLTYNVYIIDIHIHDKEKPILHYIKFYRPTPLA